MGFTFAYYHPTEACLSVLWDLPQPGDLVARGSTPGFSRSGFFPSGSHRQRRRASTPSGRPSAIPFMSSPPSETPTLPQMSESGYFGDASVIDAMSAEHRFLWRGLFIACGAHIRPGMRVLDFGCGDGSMLAYLMRGDGGKWPGCRCALGVGFDRPALAQVLADATHRLGGELPVIFTSADPRDFPGQFDLALSHEVIYLVSGLVDTFRGLHAALRPGGVLVLATGCHRENTLYPKWTDALARLGVHAYPYGIPDYVGALRDAGFENVEDARLRMNVDDYEEWVNIRGASTPNPEWFATADEERSYYTKVGKTLITAQRTRVGRPADESRRERP